MDSIASWYQISFRAAALAFAVLMLSLSAMAELGANVSSVQADQQRMHGVRRVNQIQAYAVHEIRTPNNSVVREFVSTGGKVFAVAYHGNSLGESNGVLGSYAAQLAQAMKTVHGGRHVGGPVDIQLPGMHYHASGHMRSYTVRAYLPDSVPQGVSMEEIR
jgi:Protein of unknown function (DUF2844)